VCVQLSSIGLLVFNAIFNNISIISWKSSLNRDGQQFHQHQQNKQPLLNTKKKTMTFADENRGPFLGQTQKCCGVKPVNGIPTLPLLITGSPMATRSK